jgi:hypothetical protein
VFLVTAHQITVTNSLRVFGNGPSSLWNAYNWNAFKWGEGTAKIPMVFRHLVTVDPISLASARGFNFVHLVSVDPLAMDSGRGFNFSKQVSNSLGVDSDSTDQELTDPAGYHRVFPSDVTNGDDRAVPTWAQGSAGGTTWTQQVASSTTWSAT